MPPPSNQKPTTGSLFNYPDENMVMPEKKAEPIKPRPSTGQDMMAEMMRSAS